MNPSNDLTDTMVLAEWLFLKTIEDVEERVSQARTMTLTRSWASLRCSGNSWPIENRS